MCDKCDTCQITLNKGDKVMRLHGVIVHARVNCAWKTALKYGPSRNIPAETYDPCPIAPPAPKQMDAGKIIGIALFSPLIVLMFAFCVSVLKDLFK